MGLFKREMELFLLVPGLWSKNYFYKTFSHFYQRVPNRKWSYLSHFRPSHQKLLLQDVSHFSKSVSNWFSKQETELSEQEMELFIPFPALWSKSSFTRCFPFFQRSFKSLFQNRKWNYFYLIYLIILKSILSLRSLRRFLLV